VTYIIILRIFHHGLSDLKPELVEQMTKGLHDWIREMGEKFTGENPDIDLENLWSI
jgi:hypothetical protein